MPRLVIYILLNLIFFNISKANENVSSYSCKWDNKNGIPCVEINSFISNFQVFQNPE